MQSAHARSLHIAHRFRRRPHIHNKDDLVESDDDEDMPEWEEYTPLQQRKEPQKDTTAHDIWKRGIKERAENEQKNRHAYLARRAFGVLATPPSARL